jgi:hypothetical protein
VDLFEIADVHAFDAGQDVFFERDDHRAREEVSCQAVADDAFVGLHLAEHEMRLLLAAVPFDATFEKRNLDRETVQAGFDVLNDHDAPPLVICAIV